MDYKYTVVILVLLFGITLVVYAEHPPLQEINLTDRLEIKENVLITKWSYITNPHETFFKIQKSFEGAYKW